jgi:IS4 transposase
MSSLIENINFDQIVAVECDSSKKEVSLEEEDEKKNHICSFFSKIECNFLLTKIVSHHHRLERFLQAILLIQIDLMLDQQLDNRKRAGAHSKDKRIFSSLIEEDKKDAQDVSNLEWKIRMNKL